MAPNEQFDRKNRGRKPLVSILDWLQQIIGITYIGTGTHLYCHTVLFIYFNFLRSTLKICTPIKTWTGSDSTVRYGYLGTYQYIRIRHPDVIYYL